MIARALKLSQIKKRWKCSQKANKIEARNRNFSHKHFSYTKNTTEIILLIVVDFGSGLCQVHCPCALNRKKPWLNLVSLVRKKGLIFDVSISSITIKFCGKCEQFEDETLERRQIGIWKIYCSLYMVDLLHLSRKAHFSFLYFVYSHSDKYISVSLLWGCEA